MTPLQAVLSGLENPNRQGCWLCDHRQTDTKDRKKKAYVCGVTGHVIASKTYRCPLVPKTDTGDV